MRAYSPLEIKLLLHIYTTPSPIENISAPAVVEAIEVFLANDLITIPNRTVYRSDCQYEITERGKKWAEMICDTPWPEFRWIDPRTDKESQ